MRLFSDLWFRARALLSRRRMDCDLTDEFAFHLDMETRKYESAGMDPGEARRRALIKFGGEDRFKERARQSWGLSPLEDLLGDLRYAWRYLLRYPAFSVLAVLTLALGIGGTVALFSVVQALVIRPLPVPDEDRVVTFWMDYNWRGAEFDHVREIPQSFETVAAFSNEAYTLRTERGSSLVVGTVASTELWDVLGARPFLGRTFLPGEDRPGAEPVAVLNHGLWTREFGADPDVLGRTIRLDGVQTTVVGVMPAGFYFPSPDLEIFVPLDLDPAEPEYASNGWLVLVGRLSLAATPADVDRDLQIIADALGERFTYSASFDKTRDPFLIPVREYILGDMRPVMLVLLSAVALLLLMACVNVTALLVTRTVDRSPEMSLRSALGAGKKRLARQILTESVVLGLIAGAVGLALAAGLFDLLVTALPIPPAFRETLTLDWTMLLVALGLSVLTGSFVALVPARSLLGGKLAEGALATRGRAGAVHRTGRIQRALVCTEVLVAVVLVTGASLLLRTVDALRAIDPGFQPEGVVTMDVLVPGEETTQSERDLFFDQLVEQAAALPGVTSVGLTNRLPLRDGGYGGGLRIPDRPELAGESRQSAMYRPVTPATFEALGAEVIRGRGIQPTDRKGEPLVAVVNETFARRVWGSEEAIGRTYSTFFLGYSEAVEVVGVVRDIAIDDLIGEQPMAAYYSWDQSMSGTDGGILVARTTGEAATLAGPLRALVGALDPRAAIGRVETMDDALRAHMAEPLRLRLFLGLFSLLAVLLGSVGVYGVVAYTVRRRRAEFGIRMALGARPGSLLGAVVRQGMGPVVSGVAGGTLVALVSSLALERFLFGVRPTDPWSLGAAGCVLLLVGVAAAAVPALKASWTDPATALRAD